jgi:hypothetical protein
MAKVPSGRRADRGRRHQEPSRRHHRHRILARLFEDRGLTLDRTYQLNVGGNMDFMNMLERERPSRRRSPRRRPSPVSRRRHRARQRAIGPSDTPPTYDRGRTSAGGRNRRYRPQHRVKAQRPPNLPGSSSMLCAALEGRIVVSVAVTGPSVYLWSRRPCNTAMRRPARWSRTSPGRLRSP